VNDELRAPLAAYRVMATIVGVLLVVLVLIGLPLHYGYLVSDGAWLAEGSGSGWQLGSDISAYLGVAHGWLYMIFLFCAFWLSRRAEWEIGFTAVTLASGTVPLLSFWAEHRATRRVRALQRSDAAAASR
jgi:integral membrane protein